MVASLQTLPNEILDIIFAQTTISPLDVGITRKLYQGWSLPNAYRSIDLRAGIQPFAETLEESGVRLGELVKQLMIRPRARAGANQENNEEDFEDFVGVFRVRASIVIGLTRAD